MKNVLYYSRWIVAIIFATILIADPSLVFGATGIGLAANFITSTVTWTGKQNYDYFLRPMFIGKSPWETKGVRVIPNIQSTQKLNYFGVASKLLKAYAKGFSGVAGTTHTQRDLTVYRLKAEIAEDANGFYQTVFESALKLGEWNDLSGTMIKDIIINLYRNAIASDVYRIFWLAHPYKETLSGLGNYSGTPDTDYNMLTGMWKLIFDNAATSPSDTQIKRVAVSDGAAAQVATVTLNGGGTTTSTLILTFNGVNYSRVYITSYTQTAANFVTEHAAALLLRGITLTSSGADLIFTSAIPGQPFLNPTFNGSSTVTGSVASTTANTAPSALASGESEDTFLSLYEGCDVVLKQVPTEQKVILCDQLLYENYLTYLESFTADGGMKILLEGKEYLTYRGIPIIPMNWGVHLNADFPHASGYLWAYPHRAILTEVNNLVLGLDAMSEYNETRMWYNADEQENRFRTQLKMGVNYVHNKLLAVSY